MDSENKRVQRKLRYLLSENLVTLSRVAEDLGVNYSNVSKFKNDRMSFSSNYLERLEGYLDLWLEFENKVDEYIKNN